MRPDDREAPPEPAATVPGEVLEDPVLEWLRSVKWLQDPNDLKMAEAFWRYAIDVLIARRRRELEEGR